MRNDGNSGKSGGSGTGERRSDPGEPVASSEYPEWSTEEHVYVVERRKRVAQRNRDAARNPDIPQPEPGGALGDLTGLALSGGGIRSATFCLGVAQALSRHNIIDKLDYLSTVSGGGYFGASLTTTLHKAGGGFVFDGAWDAARAEAIRNALDQQTQDRDPVRQDEKPSPSGDSAGGEQTAPSAPASDAAQGVEVANQVVAQEARKRQKSRQLSSFDLKDSNSVGHLRNYSNYLTPKGGTDYISSAAIVIRGLAANAALILWIPFILAAITCLANPSRGALDTSDLFGIPIPWPPVKTFAVTLTLLGFAFITFVLWALYRSLARQVGASEVNRPAAKWAGWLVVAVAACAFVEFQPYAIKLLFQSLPEPAPKPGPFQGLLEQLGLAPKPAKGSFLTWLGVILAPIAVIITFFRETLKGWLEGTYFSKTYSALLARGAAFAILWAGALALPLVIWIFYVHLSFWSIANVDSATLEAAKINNVWELARYCALEGAECYRHSPSWFVTLKGLFWPALAWAPYLAIALVLFFSSFFLMPNAYSLHHLYRDRLAKAFLFDPTTFKNAIDPEQASPRLTDLTTAYDAPYLLVNTAINVISSDEANRRGRNADFFLFSPFYIGSRATRYAPTANYRDTAEGNAADTGSEDATPSDKGKSPLDLATVIAISGAAASSNMGSRTIRPLSPTLAMLNVRLGYWLNNPRQFLKNGALKASGKLRGKSFFFLAAEMFSLMSEDDERVYLTDGGHIENLGIYELLRRRCKVIIAVDAEADPQMRFGSFIALQIYARIDLGIRIDLPVAAIREATLASMGVPVDAALKTTDEEEDDGASAEDAKAQPKAKPVAQGDQKVSEDGRRKDRKPKQAGQKVHVAVGTIDYGRNEFGVLVYIKASLTGDENDYVRDYGRRNPTYPHESTGDQFFTEEQFEVYRALGFHITDRFFDKRDPAVVTNDSSPPTIRTLDVNLLPFNMLRKALGLNEPK